MNKLSKNEPELFFTDTNAIREAEKEMSLPLRLIQKFLDVWYKFTEIKIKSTAELAEIIKKPTDYLVKIKQSENAEAKKNLVKMFGKSANVDTLLTKIYLPAGWNEIESCVSDIADYRFKHFDIDEGKVSLSNEWFNRISSKVNYIAHTPIQKKRLAEARADLIRAKEKEALFIQELNEHHNYSPESFWVEITRKEYLKLPESLRLVNSGNMVKDQWLFEVEICPDWIVNGYSRTYPVLQPAEKEYPETKKLWRVCIATNQDGSRTKYFFEDKDGSNVPLDFYRQHATVILPNLYEVNGGLIKDTGKRGRTYKANPLYTQPTYNSRGLL